MFWRKKHKKIDFLKAHERVEDLVESLHRHHRKKRGHIFLSIIKCLSVFVLVILILAGIIAGNLFFKFKHIYDLAISARSSLNYSIDSAKQRDFVNMGKNSLAAENSFTALAAEIVSLRNNILFKTFKIGARELNDLDYIVASASVVSRSLTKVALIGERFDKLMSGKLGASFSKFTPEQKQTLSKFIYESGPGLNGVKADLELASLNMDRVTGDGFLSPFKGKIFEAKDQLKKASVLMSRAVLVSELLPELFGYPNRSTFLVLFENSDELRPTGGFLGTYGILQTKNSDIVRFDTHDIYHMDIPMEAGHLLTIAPPDPIKKYLNKTWYMRDSNWSPDWPTSAEQIIWFYNKENALLPAKNQINNFTGEFNGVIAVTPDFVESLLGLIGSVTVNGEQFNKDNFMPLLQYKVEQNLTGQNVTSWQRKEIIGKILEEIKIKIFDLDYGQWPAAAEKINTAVAQKDILIFLKNDYLESLAKELNAGGEIKTTTGDYLFLVDSNMAALKTDVVMQRNIDYKLTPSSDGLDVKLNINYAHTGGRDWKTDDYKSYTRIYLPFGSQVIKADGFIYEKAKIYNEAGKTVIAGFVIVRVGKSTSLNIEYKLPKRLVDKFQAGGFSLYVQKQPGNRIKTIKVDVSALSAIKSYDPFGAKVNGNNIIWTSGLETDKEFSINF